MLFFSWWQVKKTEKKKELKKYAVKPAKDLRSKYEIKMAQRQADEQAIEEEKRKKEEEEKLAVSLCCDAD